jgi:hypothetical protein
VKRNELKLLQNSVRKYRSVPTVVDGKKFPSKKEARRYGELKLLVRAGKISGLRCQVAFNLVVNEIHVCKYVADFVYFEDEKRIVEDTKGFLTKEYKLKKKLMKACHGIEIRET